jgi:hypothetical protein
VPVFSKEKPGQWICSDFNKMRVCLAQCTINSAQLRLWVVEHSLDGEAWTAIDRVTDDCDLGRNPSWSVSFPVSDSAECRFFPLSQTGQSRHPYQDDGLYMTTFAFFGTLLELLK